MLEFYHLQEDFNSDFGNLNQYKSVVPLFGAAYVVPNKGTTILYLLSSTNIFSNRLRHFRHMNGFTQ